MNATEKQGMNRLIRDIVASGCTVVLVEHDIGLVMDVSSRVTVLNFGQKIADGTPAVVRRDPQVVEEIGRASCRERADVKVVSVTVREDDARDRAAESRRESGRAQRSRAE